MKTPKTKKENGDNWMRKSRGNKTKRKQKLEEKKDFKWENYTNQTQSRKVRQWNKEL